MLFRTLSIGVAAALSFSFAAEGSEVVWRGCGVSKAAFMEQCARAYENETGVNIRLSGGGATLGIEAAARGGADLGGTCRACLSSLGEDQFDVQLAIVAWDALAVVVHPDNPVDDISSSELKQVLQQKIPNWKPLGGVDEEIVVVTRTGKTSGVGHCTRLLILGDANFDYGPRTVRLASSGPVEKLVARQRRAVAVTGVSSARKQNLKILTVDGCAPTPENIASGEYPYFRPLYVAYKPRKNTEAASFVQWLLSKKGQQVVAQQGTVTLEQGAKLAQKFQHYENVEQIVNHRDLMEKARMTDT